MPLCVHHHRGEEGIHHIGVKTWEAKFRDQDNLVKRVKLRVYADILQSDYPEYEAERIGKTTQEIENYILNNEI